MDGLIGHTGLVGSHLAPHGDFACFNSRNIGDIAGQAFDTLYCAGVYAVKWWANQNPAEDKAQIEALLAPLGTVRAKRVVLISTVDIYPQTRGVDESNVPERSAQHAYGLHRYEVEQWCRARFEHVTIARLPGLFGEGLKKNVIYDLLHDNQVDKIDSRGVFQFYPLARLWDDVQAQMQAGLDLVNYVTEPVRVAEVAKVGFGLDFVNEPEGSTPAVYDIRSRYAEAMGGMGGYLMDKDAVLEGIAGFVRVQKMAA